ncbi:NADH-quinone oxidoreductase subunit N [Natronogracilivirga saccharolytica]|uniref:NADH-quinone oxidoreductase subunit N n=1 Tax=Natronogracilivirga saccharolytica TaxID=2812953 RepID=A0A8J7RQR8_9BACT|nr:NADH-quinone oxidoreductase subunit N [Natronogracilivirga saccharolytica]MBP3191277.1 NADH-quinone oxidoreductase subunit N [Natronogracilivirga saccharolytica]
MAEHIIESIFRFLPEIALTITLIAAIVADLILKERNRNVAWVVLAGLVVTGALVLGQAGWNVSIFSDTVAVDPFAVFFKAVLLIAGLFIVLFSVKSRELDHNSTRIGEYYMLITGVIFGMFLMVGATNLLLMYLAFELTSISSYVLAGFTKTLRKSAEASMKYIIFGSVSSGFLIYGISLLIGVTGAVDIYGIREALMDGVEQTAALYLAVIMIILGFSYKITAVPFHFWAPDVYQGAPVTITTFLATASKVAGFAMMIRFFRVAFVDSGTLTTPGFEGIAAVMPWNVVIAVMAALTMLIANLMALWQENIKRLLAYSSIGHAGFILMGLALLSDEGISAMMIYLAIYLFMNMGAFFVVMLVADKIDTEQISDYEGLGQRAPFLSVAMTIFMVALAGFPPTAGFIAKVYIFGATISAGWIWLVAVAGLATIISLFYYIRVVRNMFLVDPSDETSGPLTFDRSSVAILILLLIPVLFLGVYFTPIVTWAKNAVTMFGV